MTFPELVTALEKVGVDKHTEPHLRPQSYICALRETLDQYDFTFPSLSNLNENAHTMLEYIGKKNPSVHGSNSLAEDMLDNGWGPNQNISLFGLSREDRDGAKGMPTTNHSIAIVKKHSVSKSEGDVFHDAGFSEFKRFQEAEIFELKNFLKVRADVAMDPSLEARIRKLYQIDYHLIARAEIKMTKM